MTRKTVRITLVGLATLAVWLGSACQAARIIPTATVVEKGAYLLTPAIPTEEERPPEPALSLPVREEGPGQIAKISPGENLARYFSQPGDTLKTVAFRFGVEPEEITSQETFLAAGLLEPGQLFLIPVQPGVQLSTPWLLPDGEVIYGPSGRSFSINKFLKSTSGSLKDHREWLTSTGWTSAADIIQRVALENSIHPRLLLALLEWQSGCVNGDAAELFESGYILGVNDFHRAGLYGQLSWAARTLAEGYYGWRNGLLREISSPDGTIMPLSPDLNAGTVALNYYFSSLWKFHEKTYSGDYQSWLHQALDPENGFLADHRRLFGDVWQLDREAGPLFTSSLHPPELALPFEVGKKWSFISGPHPAWENAGSLSALDFAPAASETGCVPSSAWIIAVANGKVVRSDFGVVVQDLDGTDGMPSDGYEGSGWSILYLHVSAADRIPVGADLKAGDRIGHPSCEGGPATGTHLHLARKYNGEWISADGPLPFVLDGWRVNAGEKPYAGYLTRGSRTIVSNLYGTSSSIIIRVNEDEKTPP
jgi:LasA protease